jgi:hypothetical protein
MPQDAPPNGGAPGPAEGPWSGIAGIQAKLHRWAAADPGRSPPRSPPPSSPAPSASAPTSPSPGSDCPQATGPATPPTSAAEQPRHQVIQTVPITDCAVTSPELMTLAAARLATARRPAPTRTETP